jgi:nucleoside 2-deoxyribosyltransferase
MVHSMKLYLAGPIHGCSDSEANDWRDAITKLHPDTLNPMRRDYRGREGNFTAEIVELDKKDIDDSDGVIVWFEKPSVGTAMEILYAWERKKPVVVIYKTDAHVSPWLSYHSVAIVKTIEEALEAHKSFFSFTHPEKA